MCEYSSKRAREGAGYLDNLWPLEEGDGLFHRERHYQLVNSVMAVDSERLRKPLPEI